MENKNVQRPATIKAGERDDDFVLKLRIRKVRVEPKPPYGALLGCYNRPKRQVLTMRSFR